MEPIDGRNTEEADVEIEADPIKWLRAKERLALLCLSKRHGFDWAVSAMTERLDAVRHLLSAINGQPLQWTEEQARRLRKEVWANYRALDQDGRLRFYPLLRLAA